MKMLAMCIFSLLMSQSLSASNTADCVSCNTAPVITCPSNWIACPGGPTDPSVTGYATAVPGDADCDQPEISYTDEIISTGPCTGAIEIHRTWRAVYPDNSEPWLRAECTQLIKLKDIENPIIIECPSPIVIDLSADCDAVATWDEPIATDNCELTSLVGSHDSGDSFPEGTTEVTYTATDACGNEATCSFTVTVIGSCCTGAGLTITCPDHILTCPGADTDPSATGTATASFDDPNCPEPVITYSETILSEGPCPGAIKIWRSWRAEHPDDPSIHASCNQIIDLKDNTAPHIVDCPADLTINMSSDCEAIADWDEPSATDACGVTEFSSSHEPGDQFPQGSTEVTYTATDACGNVSTCTFTVTVVGDCCIDAPVIHCPADYASCPGTSTDPHVSGIATASVNDPSCPEPQVNYTDRILSTGPCPGAVKLIRTWVATNPDATDARDVCEQIIILSDKVAPVITECPDDIEVIADEPSISVHWSEPVATDDCGSVHVDASHRPGDNFNEGTTEVLYIISDACGNSDTCSFFVTVINADNGTLTCPDDIVVGCDGDSGAKVTFDAPTLETDCGIDCGSGNGEIPGYIYMGTINGSSYYCSKTAATWNDAQAIAESYGGYLAVIDDEVENAHLASFLVNQSAFIGLSDQATEGEFVWADGSALTYSNWYPGQPNDYGYGQDCVELLHNGQWNDQYCHKAQEYIMEIPCAGTRITQTGGPTSGSLFPVGTTTVSFEAVDGCGNHFSCSFDVVVESDAHLICPDDIYLSCPSNEHGQRASWPKPVLESCCNESAQNCEETIEGFIYMGTLDGKSYYCSLFPASWAAAQDLCVDAGGNLAVVDNSDENEFLASFLETQAAWIGLHDKTTEGSFKWVDGTSLGYSNWYPGQPNDYGYGQDCTEMLPNGLWNDQYCDKHLEFIMEVPCATSGIYQIDGPAEGSLFPVGSTKVTYYGVDACGNKDTCSFNVHVEAEDSGYCPSYGHNSAYLWIDEIRFGEKISWTGNDGGYGDYSDECHEFKQGETFKLMMLPGFSGARYTVYWNIWIDYNEDGDFTDSNEFVAYGSSSSGLWGDFTIPAHAPIGKKKVRISMKYGSYPGDPCATFKYGEVEDYCFDIKPHGLRSMDDASPGLLELTANVKESKQVGLEELIQSEIIKMDQIETHSTGDIYRVPSTTIDVYPNPASDEVILSSTADRLTIMDAQGNSVRDIKMNSRTQTVDITDLPSGIYFVIDRTGQTVKKLIIR